MAKRKKKSALALRRRTAVGIVVLLLALIVLVALISHEPLDDNRLTGEVDRDMSPFKLTYRNQAGLVGAVLSFFSLTVLGWLAYFLPLGLTVLSLRILTSKLAEKHTLNTVILFVAALVATMIFNIHLVAARQLSPSVDGWGGILGHYATVFVVRLTGELGAYIVLSGLIVLLMILYTSVTPMLSVVVPAPGIGWLKSAYSGVANAGRTLLRFDYLRAVLDRGDSEDSAADIESGPPDALTAEPLEHVEMEDDLGDITDESDDSVEGPEKPSRRRSVTLKQPAGPVKLGSIEYKFPPTDLLRAGDNRTLVNEEELVFTARMLKETLETFGIRIDGEIQRWPGPIITRYEFKPASGIKISQIVNLADDLALALKAKRIRIVAPIPGKAAVGVEIPNRESQTVCLRDIIESDQYRQQDLRLPLAMGKTISGKPFVADLSKMPHLLIAGATGSGKSVGMNVMITSLLYRLHPHQVRLIFIDPKMLELSVYQGIPHLGRPVVTNPKRAEKVLAEAVVEMEKRYTKLAAASVRNIVDYNKKQKEEDRLPYIVICVDELADLMMAATSSRIELLITRLAQMSRAVGIHLILATQRPSVDVITGLIKANFPARLAFQVSSKVDSRTIIDANGAEKLLGNGDMLFLQTGQPEPVRIHGAYLSGEETEAIVKSINDQAIPMMTLENISQGTGETVEAEEIDKNDPLFREACEIVVRHKQGSVSLLQRRLGVGYQRAARLIDKLEEAGIVSPFDGSKAREVLVDKAYVESLFGVKSTEAASPSNQ